MKKSRKSPAYFHLVLWITLIQVVSTNGYCCSGYKVTTGNQTLFGSNEDAWRVTPHIWFENARGKGKYGAAFTGSRYDGANGYAPQAGMNEMGLAFERLASRHPLSKNDPTKQAITNPTKYLKDILHSCQTVEEVREYVSRYDYSCFIEDLFIYTDKSGKYLLVEPYKLVIGNEPTYVISNFCPSITSKQAAFQLERYRNGISFLNRHQPDATLAFCRKLSDTMHVCREKIGDGTLLTSIWDLNHGTVNLYFYHRYQTTVQFNIQEALKKGDHLIAIAPLFPYNAEFEQLKSYQTPKTSLLIDLFLLASAGLFLFSSVYFLIRSFRSKRQNGRTSVLPVLSAFTFLLFLYVFLLCENTPAFYFPAPYRDPGSVLMSSISYIPFLLPVLIIPSVVVNVKWFRERSWSRISRWLFTCINGACLLLIGLFVYWGFYDVFH